MSLEIEISFDLVLPPPNRNNLTVIGPKNYQGFSATTRP